MFWRWLNIVMRTMHLIGVAGVGALFLFDISFDQAFPYVLLLIASGSTMLTMELLEQPGAVRQMRIIATLLKLLLLVSLYVTAANVITLLIVIVISGVIAHAPGKVRYFQVF